MIKLINPDFFRIETETVFNKDESLYYTLINLFTDPKDFELPQYRRTPFMSIVVKSDTDDFLSMNESEIIQYLKQTNVVQHSMYEEGRYETLTKMFDGENKYHTLLFEQTDKLTIGEKTLLVFAMPCNGIIRQIKKSDYYKLYNASLIVLKQRPFKWGDMFYDKLLYGLVDLDAYFEFTEFVFTDSINDMRRMNVHHFAINTTISHKDENPIIYVDDIDVEYTRLSSVVLCKNAENRQDLFQYYGKGMFCLSDIPENLSQNGGMISAKLK